MSIEPQEEVEEILDEVTETVDPPEEEVKEEEVVEEVSEEVKEEELKPKKKKTMEERQKALKKTTWEMREAERKSNEAAQRVSEQADRVEKALIALENRQATTDYKDSRPKNEDFETHEEYTEAVIDWKIKGRQPEVKTAAPIRVPEKDLTNWGMAREDAIDKHSDFEENETVIFETFSNRINTASTPEGKKKLVAEISQITDIIIDSEINTAMVQYLGQHPEEIRKISRLSPIKAAKTLGVLEDKLLNPPKKRTTNAPKPVTRTVGSGGAASLKAKNTADWMAQRNEEELKRRKG